MPSPSPQRNSALAPTGQNDWQNRGLLLEEPAEDTTEALAQLARLSGRVLDTEVGP
jgi:hypothetical protein